MPRGALALCVVTGCSNLVTSGKCAEHMAEQSKDNNARRPNAAARGYDHKWRRFRADYLSRHRECEGDACMRLPWWQRPNATDVDHIDGLGPHGPRGYDEANLQALCHACHSAKTVAHDGGFGRH
jgi:5-methylcytosine-specific restriction protein A